MKSNCSNSNYSFLTIVLPNDDIQTRAETAQRPNYRVKAYEYLPKHLEFELSRLLEKYFPNIITWNREIHYHVKVEIEKKTLERQIDFNTVSTFSVLDQDKNGYIDFDDFKKFMGKYKKEIKKTDINALFRRMDFDADRKLTFTDYKLSITPEYPGLDPEVMEFNLDKKEELLK